MVDEQGRPLVVYHGTHAMFDVFDKQKLKSGTGENVLGEGFYFTDNLDLAERYAYGITKAGRGIGKNNVMSVYLKIENPASSAKTLTEENDGIIQKQTGMLESLGTIYVVAENPKFALTEQEKQTYLDDLKQGKQTIRLGKLPSVYQNIGITPADVKTKQTIIEKATITKHAVPDDVVRQLPELFADPQIVFKSLDSSTNPNAYVAVVDAFDKDGKQMIIALSPTNKTGGYHLITSFYGRDNIQNMIDNAASENKIKYVRDKNIDLLAGHNAYLSQVGNNIKYKDDIVNPQIKSVNNRGTYSSDTGNIYLQGTKKQGAYDPELQVIIIGKDFNTGTLPHEMAHFWLDDIFRRATTQNDWTPEFAEQANNLFGILGVEQGQTSLTVEQQEKFAHMVENVVFGLQSASDGAVLPTLAYLNWGPEKYKSVI